MSTLTLPLSYRPRAYALGRRAVTLLIWIGALLWSPCTRRPSRAASRRAPP